MVKKAISWVLVGVFAYIWWWGGLGWPYLNTEGNEWSRAFILFTLISLVVLSHGARATGTGMFDGLVGTIRNFIPNLPWLVLGMIVVRSVAWAHTGLDDPLDHFTHAVVTVLLAGIATMLWYGAIMNSSD